MRSAMPHCLRNRRPENPFTRKGIGFTSLSVLTEATLRLVLWRNAALAKIHYPGVRIAGSDAGTASK